MRNTSPCDFLWLTSRRSLLNITPNYCLSMFSSYTLSITSCFSHNAHGIAHWCFPTTLFSAPPLSPLPQPPAPSQQPGVPHLFVAAVVVGALLGLGLLLPLGLWLLDHLLVFSLVEDADAGPNLLLEHPVQLVVLALLLVLLQVVVVPRYRQAVGRGREASGRSRTTLQAGGVGERVR